MNVNCNICSELFLPQSKILATPCGHTFHEECLLIWLERSETCPTCRNRTTTKSILRIYLNLVMSEGEAPDPAVLQCKVDNLEFQLKLKEKETKKHVKYCEKYASRIEGLKEEVKRLEEKSSTLETTIVTLQNQISYFKMKGREAERAQKEVLNLKQKLEGFEKANFVLTATKEEVQNMVKQNNDLDLMCLLVITLKKTLLGYEKRTKDLERNLKNSRKDVILYRTQLDEANEKNKHLNDQLECHKTCETQRNQLKRKLEEYEMGKISANDTSTVRYISESPAPLKKARHCIDVDAIDSPSVEERVVAIKTSDSPYLRFKSSSLGFLGSKLVNATSRTPGKFSILKDSVFDVDKMKITNNDVVFNGLGGHSKLDDNFPKPVRNVVALKRYKSSTKVSGKTKKLAPLPTTSTKRLDSFISLLDGDDDEK